MLEAVTDAEVLRRKKKKKKQYCWNEEILYECLMGCFYWPPPYLVDFTLKIALCFTFRSLEHSSKRCVLAYPTDTAMYVGLVV